MKNISKIFLLSILFSSCAIQGELFRLQTRMKSWNTLLTKEELTLFAQNNTNTLGQILDQKEQNNPKFAEKLRNIRISEAIMSFNGVQTTHFFYHTLLKDLAKFSYQEFIQSLSSNEQIIFVQTTNFETNIFHQEKILEKARTTYGMSQFSDVDILNYYRHILFPAVNYILVYDTMALMARYRVLDEFLKGNIDSAVLFTTTIKNNLKLRSKLDRKQAEKDLKKWNTLKSQSFMTKISDKDYLSLLYFNTLPEMDPEVRAKTIQNIKNRFKDKP